MPETAPRRWADAVLDCYAASSPERAALLSPEHPATAGAAAALERNYQTLLRIGVDPARAELLVLTQTRFLCANLDREQP